MGGAKPPELEIGTIIDGRYQIEGLLGRGGMGDVFRAKQVTLDTQVAIKVLQRSLADDELQVQRFSREAMACSRLKHPNTIRVMDFGRASTGHLYLVMELLEGRTLSRVLRREAPLDPKRVLRIALQVTKSISEAHELGLVHRDLKPQNLFLCDIHGESDFVKVLDFGIAKFMQSEAPGMTLTQGNLIIGTPLYLSPEQATAKLITPRTDLYSLGVIMYHMLCGAPPFQSDAAVSLLMKHISEQPPPLETHRPGLEIPDELNDLVFELLEKDPARRPESALVVGQRLQRMLSTSLRPPQSSRRRDFEGGELDQLALDDDDGELDLSAFAVNDEPAPAGPPAEAPPAAANGPLPTAAAAPAPAGAQAHAPADRLDPAASTALPGPEGSLSAPLGPARPGPLAALQRWLSALIAAAAGALGKLVARALRR
ncbi:MAG: serine/threonine protein kinase [Polyangiaceae bacterium]|nr:serine/threonine protein kinase [Polyangiaceae bacterium]